MSEPQQPQGAATPSPLRRQAPRRTPGYLARRAWERTVYAGYRLLMAVIGLLPPRPVEALFATLAPLAYLLWPAKRRIADGNAAVVLGVADAEGRPLPGSEKLVRARSLANYRTYGRYAAELLRLPSRTLKEIAGDVDLSETAFMDEFRARGQAAIFVGFHAGNNELGAASLGERRYDVNVVADDSAFPEMYELLRRLRASWGIKVIDWKAIREVFTALKRGGFIVLLSDWGYKPDGIPCQLFGRWTTLPSGPAVLSARGNAPIVPFFVRRETPGRFRILYGAPITAEDGSPAALARATQATATAMEQLIRTEPLQWNCFKPMWPGAAEQQLLAEAAQRMASETSVKPSSSAAQ
ncbi:MAG: lysophospholipid acyltransferase family protein [Candidatus Limnocylindrus sp.]